ENRAPRLVVEVLSPSTSSIDRFRLDEYRRHPKLRDILLVETRFPSAVLYQRQDERAEWESLTFEAMTDRIDLPAIAASLALADIYDELVFEPGHAPAR
ncbi:MAG TPA: Uma2 family endonuclease, partial [Methylobacterium sp.]